MAASVSMPGHNGPKKEEKKYIFEKKVEKTKRAWEKKAEVKRDNGRNWK